jgi:hypothetical protein
MELKQLAEVCWQLFDNGKPSATNQTLEQDDFEQLVFMESAYQLKMQMYQSRKDGDGNKTDVIAGLLSTKQYPIGDANYQGRRRATYTDEVMRLPRNSDVTNIYMVASNCDKTVNGEITQVQPSEENFYINNPDLKFFKFFVQKGNNIDTYNIPPCVEAIEVERIYSSSDLDIPLDMAYEVMVNLFSVTLKARGFDPIEDNPVDGNRNNFRYQLEQQAKSKL